VAHRRRGPTAESKARAERIAAALEGLLEEPVEEPVVSSAGSRTDPYRPVPTKPIRRPVGGLKCPGCGGSMATVYSRGVAIDKCPDCAGMWLDPGELEEMVQDASVAGSPSLERLRQQMHNMPGTRPEEIRYRMCPRCNSPMDRTNFGTISGVVVDECRQHGVFLDPDELEAIDRFVALGGLQLEKLSAQERQRRRAAHARFMEGEKRREAELSLRAERRVWWTFFGWI
jgi:Zn-finger nucleic acid-binding protein